MELETSIARKTSQQKTLAVLFQRILKAIHQQSWWLCTITQNVPSNYSSFARLLHFNLKNELSLCEQIAAVKKKGRFLQRVLNGEVVPSAPRSLVWAHLMLLLPTIKPCCYCAGSCIKWRRAPPREERNPPRNYSHRCFSSNNGNQVLKLCKCFPLFPCNVIILLLHYNVVAWSW